MRGLLVLMIVALLLAGAGVHFFGDEAGYVRMYYGGTSVEMTLWTLLGLSAAGLILLWLLVQILFAVFRVPGGVGQWRQGRRHRDGIRRSNQGQKAYVEGNWEQAREDLAQAAERSTPPLMNHILAARANAALGDDEAAHLALLEGQKQVPDSKQTLGIAEAQIQVEKGQMSLALETLLRVRAVSTSHPTVLKLLAQIYEDKKEWTQLRKLLPKLNKAEVYDSAQSLNLERRVYCALLEHCGDDKQALAHVWKQVPPDLTHDSTIASVYARRLIELGASARAEQFLREVAPEKLPDELINLYGRVQGTDANQQLATVERWLAERGQSAELLLCAGRLSLTNHKWDQAKDYFEACLQRDPNPEAYAELARLLSSWGDVPSSAECYRRGLLGVTGELPALPMPRPRRQPDADDQEGTVQTASRLAAGTDDTASEGD